MVLAIHFEHQVSDLTKYESDESTWFLNIDGTNIKTINRTIIRPTQV